MCTLVQKMRYINTLPCLSFYSPGKHSYEQQYVILQYTTVVYHSSDSALTADYVRIISAYTDPSRGLSPCALSVPFLLPFSVPTISL